MRFFNRTGMGILAAALALAACDRPAAARTSPPEPSAAATTAPTSTPGPQIPADLTPITINGTQVIIPQAIEFTPTATPTPTAPGGPPPSPTGPTPAPITPLDLQGPWPGAVPSPAIHTFSVAPADHVSAGQTVTISWDAMANFLAVTVSYRTAQDLYSTPLVQTDLIQLKSLSGSQQIALTAPDGPAYYVEITLHATTGNYDPATRQMQSSQDISRPVDLPLDCADAWGLNSGSQWCPAAAADTRAAVFQPFEHGLLVWRATQSPGPGVLAFLDANQFWAEYPQVGDAQPDGALAPPPGLAAADHRTYAIWSTGYLGSGPLRDTIGWATAQPVEYQAVYQCEVRPDQGQSCYVSTPDGRVIHFEWPPAGSQQTAGDWAYVSP